MSLDFSKKLILKCFSKQVLSTVSGRPLESGATLLGAMVNIDIGMFLLLSPPGQLFVHFRPICVQPRDVLVLTQ